MNLKPGVICFLFFLPLIFSCTKDRTFPTAPPVVTPPVGNKDSIVFGTLVINEYEASGSQFDNELSTGSDWFEIYNTTLDTITLAQNKWFVTDGLGNNTKYQLPPLVILPKGFQVIWCDSKDTVATQVHTNFNLSASGEQLGIFYQKSSTDSIHAIDTLTFGAQQSGVSRGRLPDGSAVWTSFPQPTPGASNH